MTGFEPIAIVAFALTVLGTGGVLSWLKAKNILDHPNARSSHSQPVPRGGGLAVTPTILLVWLALVATGYTTIRTLPVIGLAAMLAGLSWLDDRGGLPARVRLLAHGAAALVGVLLLGSDQLVFQGLLPLVLDRAVAVIAWVWFINLYNFMDGIDGLTGVETFALGLGLALLTVGNEAALPVTIAAAALGFLVWNWHPAKIFLGDSGSIPLGFLLGWLLLCLAARGAWAAAVILPGYYLADATVTLVRRLFRGEKVWQAHRQHFYQQAVRGGASHGWVARAVLMADLVLMVLAYVSRKWPVEALLGAVAVVVVLMALFAIKGRAAGVNGTIPE